MFGLRVQRAFGSRLFSTVIHLVLLTVPVSSRTMRLYHGLNSRYASTFQSPIDLDEGRAERSGMDSVEWGNMNTIPQEWILKNNGHTVQLRGSWAGGETPYIKLKNTGEEFTLQHVHWHWGLGDDDGTEHTLNGQRGALEMHMVFDKTSGGGSAQKLVLGQLFEYNQPASLTAPGLLKVAVDLNEVTDSGEETRLDYVFAAADLIPGTLSRVFFYSGSLTTPPYTEPIHWLVNAQTGTVSDLEMDNLRLLRDGHGNNIAPNVRSLQPLNGRKIQLLE